MTDSTKHVLVVEDDEALLMGLEENLEFEGYAVDTAADGKTGLEKALDGRFDLVLLDIMLPGMNGYEICRKMREKGIATPVIMLTARHEEFDKVHGFEMGADDYVTKPFSIKELLARVKAVMRRADNKPAGTTTYRFGEFELNTETRTLSRRGEDVSLTRTEFELLSYFATNPDQALTREQLLNDVWGTKYLGTQRSLDSFVAALRKKIEDDPHEPTHILTVHGVGYKFAG